MSMMSEHIGEIKLERPKNNSIVSVECIDPIETKLHAKMYKLYTAKLSLRVSADFGAGKLKVLGMIWASGLRENGNPL